MARDRLENNIYKSSPSDRGLPRIQRLRSGKFRAAGYPYHLKRPMKTTTRIKPSEKFPHSIASYIQRSVQIKRAAYMLLHMYPSYSVYEVAFTCQLILTPLPILICTLTIGEISVTCATATKAFLSFPLEAKSQRLEHRHLPFQRRMANITVESQDMWDKSKVRVMVVIPSQEWYVGKRAGLLEARYSYVCA